jgi:hypothetical protein
MPAPRPFSEPIRLSFSNCGDCVTGDQLNYLEEHIMAKMLEQLTVKRSKDGFLLMIEDESGTVTKLLADEDQLVEIVDEIERAQELEDADGDDDDAVEDEDE